MNMTQKHKSRSHGFTLVECMVVMLILMVTFGGIMSFRYYTVLSTERAETQLLAARAAIVISEAWRGQKGADDFDPTQQSFDDHFLVQSGSVSTFSEAAGPGYLHLGNYQIQVEGRRFNATLVYENSAAIQNVRILHVVLAWQDGKRLRQTFHLSTLTQT
ncbi:MAG: prepilin-type N-terminal cleavage/methylation domain-containing protein [Planctomycetes bacterium]|nr:prepilin-type N-terminal cleavage/methylation domain-containing protein [Planctomycetota bacterium]